MGLLSFVASLFNGQISLSLVPLAIAIGGGYLAYRAYKSELTKRAFLPNVGILILFYGLLIFVLALFNGRISLSFVFLAIAIGGGYLAYRAYKIQLRNLVARTVMYKNVYYDEKGLYIDKPGKPYLLKWDEVVSYEIVNVFWRDEYTGNPPLFNMISYLIWKDIDPEYAETGIFKFGTMRFYKKDGSFVTLPNVINPDRLTPIFNKYIYESNQKKG
jgi:hypothetical protein